MISFHFTVRARFGTWERVEQKKLYLHTFLLFLMWVGIFIFFLYGKKKKQVFKTFFFKISNMCFFLSVVLWIYLAFPLLKKRERWKKNEVYYILSRSSLFVRVPHSSHSDVMGGWLSFQRLKGTEMRAGHNYTHLISEINESLPLLLNTSYTRDVSFWK